jgi:putative nucleotidyltransferase with HDIG domain
MIELSSMVEKSRDLAALPASVTRLATVIANPQSVIGDVVEAIRFDQALTAAVLREANSVASASRREITSVKDAAVRIGGARILSHCIAGTLRTKLADELASYGYGENELWRHSVAAAVAAEELGLIVKTSGRGLEFTAALLHDIGKLVMGRTAPAEAMQAVWDAVKKNNITCERAETAMFGFSHAVLGAEIVKTWGLPDDIERAVRNHHATDAVPDSCTDVVVVSNLAAHAMGEGLGYEGMSLSIDGALSQRMGIRREDFERLCARAAGSFARTLELYT